MENTFDTGFPCFGDHGACVVLGIACMYDYGAGDFLSQRELLSKCATLLETRRVVVMVVEAAFSNRHRSRLHVLAQQRYVAAWIETDRVVGMNASRIPYIAAVPGRDDGRRASGAEDIPGAAP